MSLENLMRTAGLKSTDVCRELSIDQLTLDRWLSGAALPPTHLLRAIDVISKISENESQICMPNDAAHEPDSDAPTLVSLFSGAGGLDIGLERAGFKTVIANEIETHGCETLKANKRLATLDSSEFDRWFTELVATQRCYRKSASSDLELLAARLRPALTSNTRPLASAHIVERDIRELSAEFVTETTGLQVGSIDLIAGGPPCQPFSRAGKQETVDCDDGRLFLEFVRLVDQLRPRWFLFENVKGLVQHRTEALYSTCRHCLVSRPVSFGLRSATTSLDNVIDRCAECGRTDIITPRWEKRRGGSLDMIEAEFCRLGYTCKSQVLNARNFGVPQDRERLFIVGSRDGERFDWPAATHGDKHSVRSLFETPSSPSYVSVREALYQEGHWRYGQLSDAAVVWVKNVVRPHDEPVTWSLDRVSPTVGAHQAAKLAIAPFGVPAAQLARQQWHTLGRRQGDSPPVFVEHEYLTDQELLKLQTFPRHWYLHGTRMERAFQVGNAVPPALAEAVGGAIVKAMAGTQIAVPQGAIL